MIAGWVPLEDRWAVLKEHPKWEGHPDYVELYRSEGEPKRQRGYEAEEGPSRKRQRTADPRFPVASRRELRFANIPPVERQDPAL